MLHHVILILDTWPDLIARLLCSIFWGLATRDNLEYTRNFTCQQVVSRLNNFRHAKCSPGLVQMPMRSACLWKYGIHNCSKHPEVGNPEK